MRNHSALVVFCLSFVIFANTQESNTSLFSSSDFLVWSAQNPVRSPYSFTVAVINNSPLVLKRPLLVQASGQTLSLPSLIQKNTKDTIVSIGARSTEGLLAFPIEDFPNYYIALYWNVPTEFNSEENKIGVLYGNQPVNMELLKQLREGFLLNFVPVKSKQTWYHYSLNDQFTADVMMTGKKQARALFKINFDYYPPFNATKSYIISKQLSGPRIFQWSSGLSQVPLVMNAPRIYWQFLAVNKNFYKIINKDLSCALTVRYNPTAFIDCIPQNSNNLDQEWDVSYYGYFAFRIRGALSHLYWNFYSQDSFVSLSEKQEDIAYLQMFVIKLHPNASVPLN